MDSYSLTHVTSLGFDLNFFRAVHYLIAFIIQMIAETIAILHELEESVKAPRNDAKQSPTGLDSVKTFEQIEFYD
jgi:hypothetical protein